MSFQEALARVLAQDSRYSIHAYLFVLESLEYAKHKKKRSGIRQRGQSTEARQAARASQHVTGQELCHGARELALRQYGLMALYILKTWGLSSTSDLGEIVYNLIATGDLEKTPTDARTDFDNVYDFETVFRDNFVFTFDEVA